MVIGAETFSRILDFEDRATCVLFGDGAGAVILEAVEGTGRPLDRGILATDLHSDGRYTDLLYVDGGPSTTGTAGVVRMAGQEVFKHAVVKLAETGAAALERAGLATADVDWLVPHQANLRIMTMTARSSACRWTRSSSPCRITATPRRPRFPSRSRSPTPTDASPGATCCCSRRSAAASPGARPSSAGKRPFAAPSKPLLLTRFKSCL